LLDSGLGARLGSLWRARRGADIARLLSVVRAALASRLHDRRPGDGGPSLLRRRRGSQTLGTGLQVTLAAVLTPEPLGLGGGLSTSIVVRAGGWLGRRHG
jgi:hypothetical protein